MYHPSQISGQQFLLFQTQFELHFTHIFIYFFHAKLHQKKHSSKIKDKSKLKFNTHTLPKGETSCCKATILSPSFSFLTCIPQNRFIISILHHFQRHKKQRISTCNKFRPLHAGRSDDRMSYNQIQSSYNFSGFLPELTFQQYYH